MLRYFFVLIIFHFYFTSFAQTNFSKESRALFFAVEEYESSEFFDLKYPIKDAEVIADLLKERYNFETEIVENPTKIDIYKKLTEYKQAYERKQYDQRGQLLIFFSGHGLSRYNNGYFLPSDTDHEEYALSSSSLNYADLRGLIQSMECQHILVAIDACHSASFDPDYGKSRGFKQGRKGEENYDKMIGQYATSKSRIFLTSDALDEPTPDRSNFARQIFNGLSNAPLPKGYLRYDELYTNYLKTILPIPSMNTFGELSIKEEAEGTFIFFANRTKNIDTRSEQEAWVATKKSHTISAYEAFNFSFPNSDYITLSEKYITDLKCTQLWQSAKARNTQEAYQSYIKSCPKTDYAKLSRLKINELEANKPLAAKVDINLQLKAIRNPSFRMGGRYDNVSDQYTHLVKLDNFEIGQYEVTAEEYDLYCQSTGKCTPSSNGRLPVVNANWYDAVAYCNWLSEQKGLQKVYSINGRQVTTNFNANGYRLPTEAEWECAASYSPSGKKALFGDGTFIADPGRLNFDGSQRSKTDYSKIGMHRKELVPVGSLRAPNALQLHDLSGNVREWCHDWFDEDYYSISPDLNPKGPRSGSKRTVRGGDYLQGPEKLLTTHRRGLSPTTRSRSVGFRVARGL
ncbi:MAG: SUMF1/EgtB/PvdO family nonheme iron enzyme [Bacteroidota bacterium]